MITDADIAEVASWQDRVLVVVSLTRDVYGPFANWAAAIAWASQTLDHDGWALTLLSDPALGAVRNADGTARHLGESW